MSEFQYLNEIDSNERYFNEKLNEELSEVDTIIGDAFEHINTALGLYLKSDVLEVIMDYGEFKKHLLNKISDLL